MEERNENTQDMFACPSCGTSVSEEEIKCPVCGAMFEGEEDAPSVSKTESPPIPPPSESWSQFPPPPQDIQNPKIPPPPEFGDDIPNTLDIEEGQSLPSPNIDDNNFQSPSQGVREFQGSIFEKDVQDKTSVHSKEDHQIGTASEGESHIEQTPEIKEEVMEETMDSNERQLEGPTDSLDEQYASENISQEEHINGTLDYEDEKDITSNDLEEKMEDGSLDSDNEEKITQDPVEDDVSDLPVSLQGLNQYKHKTSDPSVKGQRDQKYENQVLHAIKEYSENRKKRYTMGTLFLGLGIVLFVLLWLVVVYDVLVIETQQWLGAHVFIILVAAGVFLTLGLYMILTYPKSSLIEVLAYLTETKNKRQSADN